MTYAKSIIKVKKEAAIMYDRHYLNQETSSSFASTPELPQGQMEREKDEPGLVAPTPATNISPIRQRRYKKTNSFLSKKAAAFLLCFTLLGATLCGYGGGLLAQQQNEATTSNNGFGDTTNSLTTTPSLTTVASTSTTLSVEEIARRTADSVVEITTETVDTGHGFGMGQYISEGAGSGVILSSDGYIVTNNHVIEGANKITVRLRNGDSYAATLIGSDEKTDVALLKIEASGLTPATLGDSDTLAVGELAVAIGNPLGQLGGTVTDGIISALDRQIELDGNTMDLLQTNAAINPGNSGGGLFNGQGQLIGIVVAKSSGSEIEGLGFAIPINDVKTVVQDLKNYGYVKGRIDTGMNFIDISNAQMAWMYNVSNTGVYVLQVNDGSKAAAAGFQVGDRVIAVDDTSITSLSQLNSLLDSYEVGDTVTFTLARGNQQGTLQLQLTESTK